MSNNQIKHTMKKFILALFNILFICLTLSSQNKQTITIKGVVTDSISKETIPYATIKLSGKNNPLAIEKAFATESNGKFSTAIDSVGEYILSVQYIGKSTVNIPLNIKDYSPVNLGNIYMKDDENTLAEVTVSAQKPLVTIDMDKIIYSIQDDPDSKTNNVFDMLRKVPMVTVDGQDKISLKGSTNFKIYLNGKPSNMITNNPKDVLKGMPANTVKDIQVITDPGAKYDAEGISGIINIITVQSTSMGGYTATLNGNTDTQGAFGGGIYLMMKYGKIGFTGNYNYYNHRSPRAGYSSSMETALLATRESGTSKSNGDGQYGSGELSYEIDSLNLVNFSFNRYAGKYKSYNDWTSSTFDSNNDYIAGFDRDSRNKSTYGGTDFNFDYQRTSRKIKDQLFTASYKLSINPSDSESKNEYLNVFNSPDAATNTQFTDADTKEHTFQADFTTPFRKIHTFEAGMKYIIRINKSNSGKNIFDGNQWNPEVNPMNDSFKHQNDIVAAYLGYSVRIKKWGFKTGLRYEYTDLKAKYELMSAANFNANYSNLVPSATISYQLTPTQNIRFGYNMRIYRPSIQQLNPYEDTSNPNSTNTGNPNLDAVKSHTINTNYGLFTQKFNTNINLSYSFEDNSIQRVTSVLPNGSRFTTYDNIGKTKRWELSTYANWSPNMKFNLYGNISATYIDLKEDKPNGLSNNGFCGYFFGGFRYTLPWELKVDSYMGAQTPFVELQSKGVWFYYYGFGISKSFLKDKLNISLRSSAPFNEDLKFKMKEDQRPSYYYQSEQIYKRRSFGISISYRFGELKSQIKKAMRGIKNDDSIGGNNNQMGGQGNMK